MSLPSSHDPAPQLCLNPHLPGGSAALPACSHHPRAPSFSLHREPFLRGDPDVLCAWSRTGVRELLAHGSAAIPSHSFVVRV